MQRLEELDCLVIGDEPAGLWLLQLLETEISAGFSKPNLGWVSYKKSIPRIPLAYPLASKFGISVSDNWSAELVTPHRSLDWNQQALAAEFPQIRFPDVSALGGSPSFKNSNVTKMTKALCAHPDLYSFSSGLWRLLGRTSTIQPESCLLATLLCTELSWWQPDGELSENIHRIDGQSPETQIKFIDLKRKGIIAVHLNNEQIILTKKLVFNTTYSQMRKLQKSIPSFAKRVDNINFKLLSYHSLYPLKYRVRKPALPSALKPISVFFDTLEIPDPQTEVWPFEYAPEKNSDWLTLWVTSQREIYLPELSEQFRAGTKRMNFLFPFLSEYLQELSTPLEVESCSSESYREGILQHLEENAQERYINARLSPRTRHKDLYLLLPSLHCHLPYPLGTLYCVSELLDSILDRKKIKKQVSKASVSSGLTLRGR